MNVRYLLWHLSSQSFILELYQNNQVALLDINGLSEQKIGILFLDFLKNFI